MKPVALIIRDGWGISPKGLAAAVQEGNGPLLAKLPFHDYLYKTYPQSRLSASGEDVGLPAGQMGNSEVGHLNLGAGRIVYQELTRINKAITDGTLATNTELVKFLAALRRRTVRFICGACFPMAACIPARNISMRWSRWRRMRASHRTRF